MLYDVFYVLVFFFFKQKTAYEMRISDWSSDVCSSDLKADAGQARRRILLAEAVRWARATAFADSRLTALGAGGSRHSPLESMGQSSMNMITTDRKSVV